MRLSARVLFWGSNKERDRDSTAKPKNTAISKCTELLLAYLFLFLFLFVCFVSWLHSAPFYLNFQALVLGGKTCLKSCGPHQVNKWNASFGTYKAKFKRNWILIFGITTTVSFLHVPLHFILNPKSHNYIREDSTGRTAFWLLSELIMK